MPILTMGDTEELSHLPKAVVQSQASTPGVHLQSSCSSRLPTVRWGAQKLPLGSLHKFTFPQAEHSPSFQTEKKRRGEVEDLLRHLLERHEKVLT